MSHLTLPSWLSISGTVFFTVVGQLLVKKGMVEVGTFPTESSAIWGFVCATLGNVRVVTGLTCAVLAAGCWTVTVSRVDLSLAYPFMALAIVLVLALSGVQLGEHVPFSRWLGVAIVCLGLIIASRSG